MLWINVITITGQVRCLLTKVMNISTKLAKTIKAVLTKPFTNIINEMSKCVGIQLKLELK